MPKHQVAKVYQDTVANGQTGVTAKNNEGPITWRHDKALGEIHLGPEDISFVIKQGDLPTLAFALLSIHNQIGNPS